jgi:hypothetical protein
MLNVPVDEVFDLYSGMTRRTLLRCPHLPSPGLTMKAPPATPDEAARIIEKVFESNGIVIIPDGEKFALVVPVALKSSFVPHSADIKPPPEPAKTGPVHTGEIDLKSVSIDQVLDVYMMLAGRKLTANNAQPPISDSLSLSSATPLSKKEVLYAFDMVLSFYNLNVVPVGKDEASLEWINPPK